ncbi:SufB/SufD family protein [Facklamia miroungae]|uniref:Fe-S cluster assembly protein SufD n=1 Tax=Facklamia miroungae TaxID=120956 RepID=A0A1G7SPU0_9LACT|nr:SufD family Fe-S cluster assembly protein [Facklamia miroungae]NKZ29592.1 SufD family Fe-S cluster assembly protein [Facklamia miroungae]SDG24449.1 Fe-S cluster assembly protein SufD [Facklamia miroungae]
MTQQLFTPTVSWLKNIFDQSQQTIEQLKLPEIERAKIESWPLFIESNFIPSSIDTRLTSHSDIIVADWQTAQTDHEQLLKKYLFQAIPANQDKISAYQLAHLNNGTLIYVPDNYQSDEVFEWEQNFDHGAHQYLLLVVGKNSRFTFFEKLKQSHIADHSQSYTVEIVLEDGANLHYMAIDQTKTNQASYIRRHALAKDHAHIQWSIGSFNDGATIVDLASILKGQGSQAHLSEVAISNQNFKQILDSKISNYGHHSIGHINQRGVALDQAVLTMNGIGKIFKNAKNADAQQENRLLMLSDQARGDANPILLIDEFEVTAGHAASVSKVDDNQLWYLMTRGINRSKAEYLVIRGFLMKTLNQIKDPARRQLMIDALDQKLKSISTGDSLD